MGIIIISIISIILGIANNYKEAVRSHPEEVRRLIVKIKKKYSKYFPYINHTTFRTPGPFKLIAIHDFVMSNWSYTYDRSYKEDLYAAYEQVEIYEKEGRFDGDCDDFAILIAALLENIGYKTAIVAGRIKGKSSGHATACVFMPSAKMVKLAVKIIRKYYKRVTEKTPTIYNIKGYPCLAMDWDIGGTLKLTNIKVLYSTNN